MGTNKRYADSVDRQMNQRIIERIMGEGSPIGLSDAELELDIDPLTRTPRPVPVTAWVRYGLEPIKVDVTAVAWTRRAVAIEWPIGDGQTHRAWVWASAVTGRNSGHRTEAARSRPIEYASTATDTSPLSS